MRMKLKAAIVSAALAASVAAPAAQAASFTFSESFERALDMANGGASVPATATGSFDGDLSGTLITNLRNISVYLNGMAFVGNGALYAGRFDAAADQWTDGGATASLDGSANNFFFSDVAMPSPSPINYYFHISDEQSVAATEVTEEAGPRLLAFNAFRGKRSPFVVTQVNSAVPEPASWALMIAGFGMVGGAARYRRRRVGGAARDSGRRVAVRC